MSETSENSTYQTRLSFIYPSGHPAISIVTTENIYSKTPNILLVQTCASIGYSTYLNTTLTHVRRNSPT